MNTIISKRTTPFTYTKWNKANGNLFAEYSITVDGGAGVLGGTEFLSGRPLAKRALITPEGVATVIDDDTLKKLEAVPKFNSDVSRGLILILKNKKVEDQSKIDEIAKKEMLDGDHITTRPLTPTDLENAGAVINDDGSVNISKAIDDVKALRDENAGRASYAKKRVGRRGVHKASVK